MKSNNIKIVSNTSLEQIDIKFQNSEIFFVKLPFIEKTKIYNSSKNNTTLNICKFTQHLSSLNNHSQYLVFFGPMYLLPYINNTIDKKYYFQNLISVRLNRVKKTNSFFTK